MVQVRFDLNFDRSYPKAECIYQIALPQFYEEGKGASSFIPRPDGEKAIAASPHIRQGGCKNTMGISETSLYDPEQGSSAGLSRHPVYQISHGLLEVFGFRCIEGEFRPLRRTEYGDPLPKDSAGPLRRKKRRRPQPGVQRRQPASAGSDRRLRGFPGQLFGTQRSDHRYRRTFSQPNVPTGCTIIWSNSIRPTTWRRRGRP